MTADVQRELAEALRDTDWRTLPLGHVRELLAGASNKPGGFTDLAADLLPTVQALIADAEKRAAAVELNERADVFDAIGEAPAVGRLLRARAAALDPS